MALTIISLVIGFVVTFLATPLMSRAAHALGILDHPDDSPTGYKVHEGPTPYLGGLAMYLGVGAGWLLIYLSNGNQVGNLVVGFLLAVALGLLGLWDDIRHLPRSVRLIGQVGAAAGAWAVGFQAAPTPEPALNVAVTLLWIVGITNAFNLLDNMDGLSSGLAAIGAFSFGVMAIIEDLPGLAIASFALAGAAWGFRLHNKHPAKVYMGDAGSTFLGFLLALIGMQLRFDNLLEVTFLVPVVVLGIPIFDTTLVVLTRLKNRRGIFRGGRDHVSHRLVQTGLPVKAAVWLLLWCGACLGWLGLVISRSNVQVGWMLLGFVMALGVFFGGLLWNAPSYADRFPNNQETRLSPLRRRIRQRIR